MNLLAPLAILLAGALVARVLLARGTAPATWPAAVILAPAVGFGSLSIGYFLWRLAGLPSSAFALPGWLLVIGALIVGGRHAWNSPKPALPAWRGIGLPLALALSGGGLMIAGVLLRGRQMPFGTFDAIAIWTARARLLHLGDNLPHLLDLVRGGHPDYPLLLPGSLAAQFAMAGSLGVALTQMTGAAFALAAAGAVAVAVVRLGGRRRWGLLAAALLIATPRFLYWGASQCADVPLGYLWVLALAALATLALGERPLAPAPLAGFLLGLIAWTKNEGLPLTALLVALFVIAVVVRRRRHLLLPVFLGAAPAWLAVGLFRLLWKPRTDLHFFVGDLVSRVAQPQRWQTVAEAFGERLLPWKGFADWGLVWSVVVVALVLGAFSKGPASPTLRASRWALALCWFAWFGVFVGTPVELDWHLHTALDRLIVQLLPLTLAVAFAGLGQRSRADERAPRQAE